MIQTERQEVRATLDEEGFDYAFRHYSDFKFVEDKKFHRLRKRYIEAADALDNYIGESE